ncbi:MAG: DUF1189 family protein [Clostridiales bacterium]|nr:DUF1189 family protein [Clostridiales bacterium]
MKKIIDYLKRYYQCIYDYTLYRKFLREPMLLAILFVLPMFILFTMQTYSGAIQTPKFVEASLEPYYELLSGTTYDEIIEFKTLEEGETSPWTVEPTDIINLEFEEGLLNLEQEFVLDKTIETNELSYRLIVDTNETYAITLLGDSKYSEETADKLGFDKTDMVAYITSDYAIMNMRGSTYSYSLSELEGSYLSTESIYLFLRDNYVNKSVLVQFSAFMSLFLFGMYYLVITIVMRSLLKRHGFQLSRSRKAKITFYSMQPGLYVYFITTFIMSKSQFALSFVVPVVSMLAMTYITTKVMDQVRDYIIKEQKAEKRLKQKGQFA